MSKCLYCNSEMPVNSAFDCCDRCGVKVWGEKMFNAIKQNMENARDSGDLCHANNTCEVKTPSENPGNFF